MEQLYPCDRCKRKLKSKLSLKKHLEMHAKRDSEDPKFICNICDRGNEHFKHLKTFIITKFKKKINKFFTVFSQGYMLKDHLRTHSGKVDLNIFINNLIQPIVF